VAALLVLGIEVGESAGQLEAFHGDRGRLELEALGIDLALLVTNRVSEVPTSALTIRCTLDRLVLAGCLCRLGCKSGQQMRLFSRRANFTPF
jgi:hypothetical protein